MARNPKTLKFSEEIMGYWCITNLNFVDMYYKFPFYYRSSLILKSWSYVEFDANINF